MKVLINPKPQTLVNAFLLVFIIHSMQIGVGIQGFQRVIYLEAKQDAWISVVISGILTAVIGWVMVKTLELYQSADLYGIQYDVFGKWLGNLLNLIFVLYFLGGFYVIIRNYIEVIQAWIFPELPTWFLSISLMFLVSYAISGGFRTIVGVSFFSIVLSLWLILMLTYPFQFANWDYLLPIFEARLTEILSGAKQMTFTVIGFEIIYAVYPFIKEKEKVNKFMQLGLFLTTILYLALMIVSLAYFSGGQLERTIWGTLSLFKIVRFPFIERFEYVAISFWALIILPNMILYLWAGSRGLGRIFGKSAKKMSWVLMPVLFITLQFSFTRTEINLINDYYAKIAFYIVYIYPFALYGMALIKKKFFSKRSD